MKRMAIEVIYCKPNTNKPTPGHKIYPYLLRKLQIDRPNQIWATDITPIPMARGFVYLTAVADWFRRRVLSWRESVTGGGVLYRGAGGSARETRHAGHLQYPNG
jgi:putative transposase